MAGALPRGRLGRAVRPRGFDGAEGAPPHEKSQLERGPRRVIERYERERPCELVHIDTKKLGRFWSTGKRVLGPGMRRSPHAGWQYLHVAVDDRSRLAYAGVLSREDGAACAAFLRRAAAW